MMMIEFIITYKSRGETRSYKSARENKKPNSRDCEGLAHRLVHVCRLAQVCKQAHVCKLVSVCIAVRVYMRVWDGRRLACLRK